MRIIAPTPKVLPISLEPTEIRTLRFDFSLVLPAAIQTLTVDDPAGMVSGLAPDGRVAVVTLAAGSVETTSVVTISAVTAAGHSERQRCQVTVTDPAGGILEVYP